MDEIERNLGCLVLELARLRKIEEAARAVADGAYIWHISEDEIVRVSIELLQDSAWDLPQILGYDDPGVEQFCRLVTDLRKALETETDG